MSNDSDFWTISLEKMLTVNLLEEVESPSKVDQRLGFIRLFQDLTVQKQALVIGIKTDFRQRFDVNLARFKYFQVDCLK